MKYIIVLGDGMADYHRGPLGNATPLEKANKPNIDFLAQKGRVGLIKTIPSGMKPASDVANLSVMGYDPQKYYSGRSPLEALSIGVEMNKEDIAIRTNIVTLSEEENYEDKVMLDYSAGEISTKEAKELMEYIQKELGTERFSFNGGISYRHCVIDHSGSLATEFTPPHDISDKKIKEYLPKGENSDIFLMLQQQSYELLKRHPINIERSKQGKNTGNSLWFWGAGTKPNLTPFYEKFGLKGAVISAVDLLKGIAIGASMKTYDVVGATGNIDTNFMGKAKAVMKALEEGNDFVYLHIEAPDECGHQGDGQNKILAIEKIDEVVGYIYKNLKDKKDNFVIAVLPDHATPLCLKTHTDDPVPYLIYKSNDEENSGLNLTEVDASKGKFIKEGPLLIAEMLNARGNK